MSDTKAVFGRPSPTREVLSFAAFRARLRPVFGPELDTAAEGTPLEQLGIDSLDRFELLLIIDELGAFPDDEEFASAVSLDDLYSLYLRGVTDPARGGRSE